MTNKPRQIGTAAETAVALFLRNNGFGCAERRALRGIYDAGDIAGTPGVCWEIKGGDVAKHASDGQVEKWLCETDRETKNAYADIGVLVMQRSGIGAPRCGQWWAVVRWHYVWSSTHSDRCGSTAIRMTLEALVMFLRENGYGDPL